jgi:hypothetical protein
VLASPQRIVELVCTVCGRSFGFLGWRRACPVNPPTAGCRHRRSRCLHPGAPSPGGAWLRRHIGVHSMIDGARLRTI